MNLPWKSAGIESKPKYNIMSKDAFDENIKYLTGFTQEYDNNEAGIDTIVQSSKKAKDGFAEFTAEAINNKQAIDDTTHTYDAYVISCNKANAGQAKLGSSSKLASFGMQALATAGNMLLSMAISWAVGKGLEKLNEFIHQQEIAIEKGEKAKNKITEITDEYNNKVSSLNSLGTKFAEDESSIQSTGDALDSIATKYTELSKGVDLSNNENISLSDSEYQNFLDISNQLAELYPSLVSSYDLSGNAILKIGDSASETSQKLQELYKTQQLIAHTEIAGQIQDNYEGEIAQNKEYLDENKQLNEELKEDKKHLFNLDDYQIQDSGIRLGYASGEVQTQIQEVLKRYGLGSVEVVNPDGVGTILKISTEYEGLSENDKQKLQNEINGIVEKSNEATNATISSKEQKIAANKLKAEASWNNLLPQLTSYLQTESNFSSANEQLQNAIISQLGNFNIDIVAQNYNGNIEDFLYGEIIQPINELTPEAQSSLASLFKLDKNALSFKDYKTSVNKSLVEIFGNNKEQQSHWTNLLGIDKLQEEYDNQLQTIKGSIKGSSKKLSSLSGEDLQIAYDIVANDKFSGTFDELIEKVKKSKQTVEEEGKYDISLLVEKEDSIYKEAKDATESANKGDTYASMVELKKKAKELLKSGDVGTDDFKSIAKMFSPSGADDYKNFEENLGKINRYFTSDNSGVKNFLKDLEKNDFAKYDKETKQWSYSINDLEEAARKMGMGFEPFMAMFGELEDKGFHNDFFGTTEEGFSHLNELQQGLYTAQQELYKLENDPNTKNNTSAIEAKKAEIEEYKQRIEATTQSLDELLSQGSPDEKDIYTNKEALDNYRNNYNNTLKDKYSGTEEGEAYLNNYRDNFITNAQANGYTNAGVNDRGNLVLDVEKSNKRIKKENQALISSYENLKEKSQEAYGSEDAEKYSKKTNEAYKKIKKAAEEMGLSVEEFIEKYSDNDSPKTIKFDTELDAKELEKEEKKLENGGTIEYQGTVEYQGKLDQTTIEAIKNENGVVEYHANIDGVEVELEPVTNSDGTITYQVIDNNAMDTTENLSENMNTLGSTVVTPTVHIKDFASKAIKTVGSLLTNLNGKKATTTIETVKITTTRDSNSGNNGTGNKNTKNKNTKKKVGRYNGTFHSEGTLPAHATGTTGSKKISIKRNEEAVINEVGKEGVVRDGKLLTFNNGYPAKVNLKRGDIVFNHKQMEELEKKGYVTNSHAKIVGGESAFSEGTVVSNAYVTGSGGGKPVGDTTTSKKKTTSKKRTTTKKRTDSNNNDSKQKKTTKKNPWDSFEKWLDKLFDWIEIRLDKLSKITERWTSLAENAVNYSKKEYYYKKAINATSKEIKNNQKAEDKYRSFALQVGTKGAKAAGIDNPKQWAKSMLKNLENGVLLNSKGKVSGSAIKTYGEKKSSILDSMNEWLQKAISSKEKVQELADSYADLYESLENLANNKADEKVDKLSDALSTLETKYDLATSLTQKQSNIASQNKNAKDVLLARQTAKNTTSSSLSSAKSALKKLGFKPDGKTAIDVTAKMKPKQIQAVTRYNKALEANQTAIKNLTEAQNEYSKTIYENTHTLFTNIIDDFEYLQSIIEHKANLINKAMELNEAKGYRNSQVYYRQSLNSAQDKQNSLTDEYADAKAQLEKNLKNNPSYKGTDNYKDDLKTLHDLEEQLWDVDIEMAELQQSLNELEWDNFDKLQESISRVSDEAEFLIDELSRKELTDNDIGGLTDEGKATMALYAGNYGTAKEQAKLYADEIQKWKEQLAKDPENQTLIDHIHELEDAQRDYISSVQDTKYAMIDLAKEGFEAQKQFLQDTIDKYKDLMETQEDAYEYQKTLNDMVKEINNVQKQIEVYSGDTSEENRAKLQQLNADLKDKQESLQDTQRQKLTSDINDMFDDLMDNYGDYIDDLTSKLDENFDSLINAVNAGLSDTKTTIEEFAKGIGINISDELSKIQSGTDVLQNTKEGITSIVGGQQAIIDSANVNAEKIINAIHQKEEKLDDDLNKAQNTGIKNADTAKAKAAAEKAKASEAAKAKTRAEQEKAEKLKEEQAKKNANDYQKALKFIVEHFYAPKKGTKASDIKNTVKKKIYQLTGNLTVKEADLKTLAKQLGVKESNLYSKLNSLGVFKAIGKNGTITATAKFAKGTKKVPKDMIGQVGEKGSEIVYRSADGSILTPLGENDMVFSHEMSKNLYELAKQRNIATVPGVEDSGYNKTVNNNNVQGGDVNVYLGGITITGVQNAEDLTSPAFQKQFTNVLKNTIKKDRNVRGLLMEVTVNEAFDKHHNSSVMTKW